MHLQIQNSINLDIVEQLSRKSFQQRQQKAPPFFFLAFFETTSGAAIKVPKKTLNN